MEAQLLTDGVDLDNPKPDEHVIEIVATGAAEHEGRLQVYGLMSTCEPHVTTHDLRLLIENLDRALTAWETQHRAVGFWHQFEGEIQHPDKWDAVTRTGVKGEYDDLPAHVSLALKAHSWSRSVELRWERMEACGQLSTEERVTLMATASG